MSALVLELVDPPLAPTSPPNLLEAAAAEADAVAEGSQAQTKRAGGDAPPLPPPCWRGEDARSAGGESGRLLRVLGRCDRGVTGLAPPEAPPTARPDGL